MIRLHKISFELFTIFSIRLLKQPGFRLPVQARDKLRRNDGKGQPPALTGTPDPGSRSGTGFDPGSMSFYLTLLNSYEPAKNMFNSVFSFNISRPSSSSFSLQPSNLQPYLFRPSSLLSSFSLQPQFLQPYYFSLQPSASIPSALLLQPSAFPPSALLLQPSASIPSALFVPPFHSSSSSSFSLQPKHLQPSSLSLIPSALFLPPYSFHLPQAAFRGFKSSRLTDCAAFHRSY